MKKINILPLPETYDTLLADSLNPEAMRYSEMTHSERCFLNGLIRLTKPKKVLEVGVSAGASSYIILNAIKDIKDSRLTSIDLAENWYKGSYKPVGWVLDQYWKSDLSNWTLIRGKDPIEVIENIEGEIDFCLIDTAHIHPVDVLNFLVILPFLKKDAIVVVHDISLFAMEKEMAPIDDDYLSNAYGSKYLFDIVVADKLLPQQKHESIPNIGAFQTNKDTWRYIDNLFLSLQMRWITPFYKNKRMLKLFSDFFAQYYDKSYSELFMKSVDIQAAAEEVWKKNQANKSKLDGLIMKIKNEGIDRVIIYGAGFAGRKILEYLNASGIKVECFIDGNEQLHGIQTGGIGVNSPENILKQDNRLPIVLGAYKEDMIKEMIAAIRQADNENHFERESSIYHI